jgi:hypothetical protein
MWELVLHCEKLGVGYKGKKDALASVFLVHTYHHKVWSHFAAELHHFFLVEVVMVYRAVFFTHGDMLSGTNSFAKFCAKPWE